MDFQGPETADLANVYSLNLAFLDLLRGEGGTLSGAGAGGASVCVQLAALGRARADRLAQCPFLIFTLTESSGDCWRRLFDDEEQPDLVNRLVRPPEPVARLTAATLGFLWELAKRNPYAARLVSGASLGWCEQLADSLPLRLFQFAASEPGILSPRLAARVAFWAKLLAGGTSDEQEVRHSAQLCALQTVLTQPGIGHYRPLRAAACSMPALTLRIAERRRRPWDEQS